MAALRPSRPDVTSQKVIEELARTTEAIYSLDELRGLLDSGRRLRIKYGVDVTAPYLHIGHAVNLWMMRRLQDLGHTVLFLIGDFTTRIGDPTGRSKGRPIIPREEIAANAERFIAQARLVLRFDDPTLLEIRRNSEWYEQLGAGELLRLLAMVTHARLSARDMFQARMREGADIHMHELVYPLLQGYDSVMLRSDLTIIGSDQLFNEMLGRFYQERFGQAPQVVLTTKITPGIDGRAKQSKSLDNYIGLGHSPRDKFGRAMRIPDALIGEYLRVYTDLPLGEVEKIETHGADDPMGRKLRLAEAIVRRYHGAAVAAEEHTWFRETFSARQAPDDAPTVEVDRATLTTLDVLRSHFGAHKSNSELRRLCAQGGVVRNGEALRNPDQPLTLAEGDLFRAGKRVWFRIRLAEQQIRGEA